MCICNSAIEVHIKNLAPHLINIVAPITEHLIINLVHVAFTTCRNHLLILKTVLRKNVQEKIKREGREGPNFKQLMVRTSS